MKKYAVLVFIFLLVVGFTVSAQDQTSTPARKGQMREQRKGDQSTITPEKRAERMATDLGLTNAEKVKVQALFEKQDAKMKAQHAEMKKVREEQRAKIESERKVQDQELEKIIGKEKFQKHQSMRAERHTKVKQRHEKMKHRTQIPSNDSTSIVK